MIVFRFTRGQVIISQEFCETKAIQHSVFTTTKSDIWPIYVSVNHIPVKNVCWIFWEFWYTIFIPTDSISPFLVNYCQQLLHLGMFYVTTDLLKCGKHTLECYIRSCWHRQKLLISFVDSCLDFAKMHRLLLDSLRENVHLHTFRDMRTYMQLPCSD